MQVEVKLPELGENVDSGDVASVLVAEGDMIAAEQDILEIETDKAVVPVPSTAGGRVAKVHVKSGDAINVGAVLITIDTDGAAEQPAAAPAATKPEATETAPPPAEATPAPEKPAPVEAPAPAAAVAPAAPSDPPIPAVKHEAADAQPSAPAGPATRRLARELGVDINRVRGTGEGGRITREDVIAAVRSNRGTAAASSDDGSSVAKVATPSGRDDSDDWGGLRREPLSKIRKTIAARMVESATTIPHVTNFDDADITDLERIRKGGLAGHAPEGVKLTMMPFLMKSIAAALRLHPAINASLDMDSGEVVYKKYVNLGVAVDTDRGLVVPVIRDVDRMSIPQLASALGELIEKARTASFGLDDLRGGHVHD